MRSRTLLSAVGWVLFLLVGCASVPARSVAPPQGPLKVVVDTDMGWDDVLAILYLMKSPTVEILGVTVTGLGEANLLPGVKIAQTLLALGGPTRAQVHVGAEDPLSLNHVFPQPFREDMNTVLGLLHTLPAPVGVEIGERPAWEYLSDTLDGSDDVVVLALGGFNNLARMLDYNSTVSRKAAGRIYAMAGAVFVDGNVQSLNGARPDWDQGPVYSTNSTAEWNVFIDPLAAQKVFQSELPLTLVPLDVCNHVVLDASYTELLDDSDAVSRLAKQIFAHKNGSHSEGIRVPIFDPLAAVILDGGIGFQATEEFLDVTVPDALPENQSGNTYVTDSGTRKIRIVQGVSQRAFAKRFQDVMNGDMSARPVAVSGMFGG